MIGAIEIGTGISYTGLLIASVFGLYLFRLISQDKSMDRRADVNDIRNQERNHAAKLRAEAFQVWQDAQQLGYDAGLMMGLESRSTERRKDDETS